MESFSQPIKGCLLCVFAPLREPSVVLERTLQTFPAKAQSRKVLESDNQDSDSREAAILTL